MNDLSETLALEGGAPALPTPRPPAPLRWGEPELEQLRQAIGQQSLFYWKGPQTAALLSRFHEQTPLEHTMACSSGTAAIHIALAAAGIAPGDEVIVPPITDMGTVIGILYQLAVPVFADLEATSANLCPVDVRRKITPKTRAIIVVHLAGNPVAMEPFQALAREFGLLLIEDCAQAWGARYQGKPVGTMGDVGCFSLNDFKHIGAGDGGIVGSNDATIGPKLRLFGDKGYGRTGPNRGVQSILAPNYRISELQSAVGVAQLGRLPCITQKRHELGEALREQLTGLPGLEPASVAEGGYSTWWFQHARLAPGRDRDRYVAALQAEGAEVSAGYIPTPLYRTPVFQEHAFFAGQWPIKTLGLTSMDYREVCCPVAEEILATMIRMTIHESMTPEWIEGTARAFRKVNAAVA